MHRALVVGVGLALLEVMLMGIILDNALHAPSIFLTGAWLVTFLVLAVLFLITTLFVMAATLTSD